MCVNKYLWPCVFCTYSATMRLLYLSLFVFAACQSPKSAVLPQVTAIQNAQITLADGSTQAIPHYGDPAYTIFYIVRHSETFHDNPNPQLTAEGFARAERLGKIIDNARIDRVCTVNSNRAVATSDAVQYWAGGPPTETFPAEAQADWLTETLASSAGKNLFYIGHDHTIPQLLNQLVGKNTYNDLPAEEFSRFYIAITRGVGNTEVLEMQY